MNNKYYVYILCNKTRSVLYVGMTNDLSRRLSEHKSGAIEGFTKKYNVHYLVYAEAFNDVKTAILREKQIKHWSRAKKGITYKFCQPRLAGAVPLLSGEISRLRSK